MVLEVCRTLSIAEQSFGTRCSIARFSTGVVQTLGKVIGRKAPAAIRPVIVA
jgi:hypothetical protein